MSETFNLTIDQGAKLIWYVGYDDSNGDLVDLTGYTAKMQARQKASSSTTILDLSSDDDDIDLGEFTSEGETYNIRVTVDAADTAALPTTKGVYDLEVYPAGVTADAIRVVGGLLTISPEVTR
jgi:hypothetical protein